MENGGSSKRRQKVRFAPKEYFLPRRPLHVSIAVNGSCILAGLGVGMLIEKWIGLKVKEDGGYVTLGSKKEEVPETVTTAPLQQQVKGVKVNEGDKSYVRCPAHGFIYKHHICGSKFYLSLRIFQISGVCCNQKRQAAHKGM